jgi:signal transduction histidine kinase
MSDSETPVDQLHTAREHALARFLRTAAVAGGALALAGAATIVADGNGESLWSELHGLFVVYSVFFMVVSWLVVPHQPANPVTWTMVSAAFFGGLFLFGVAAASLIVDDPAVILTGAEQAIPADLPRAAALVNMFTEPALLLALFPLLTFGLLLFPDGDLPSPGWRWVGWLAGVGLFMLTVFFGWGFRPSNTRPAEESGLIDLGFVAVLIAVILSLAALVVRYRRTRGIARQQLKWVVWGASIFGLTMVVAVSLGGTQHEGYVPAPLLVATAIFLISYGIAVGKYRLYDIDVVISKSVTFISLAVALTMLYGAAVFAYIQLFADEHQRETGELGVALPIGATRLVAISFEPIRSRMQRWANGLVYGNRASPHEVLSRVTARLSDSEASSSLTDLARLLAEGTGADQAVVWVHHGDILQPGGVWPVEDADRITPTSVDQLIDGATSGWRPVLHGEESFGALSIAKSTADPITPADSGLLSDVAAGAGLLLRNISLSAQLKERAEELRESRRRLIAAQDAERHRLERNLHDGAQQQVVALKVKLGIARTIADREGAEEIATRVAGLAEETQGAVDALRSVAHGIYPPLLEAEGLGAALRALARSTVDGVDIEISELARYAPQVEATVYFCLVEAAEQARMSGASFVQIRLSDRAGEIVMEIEHDGRTREDELSTVADRIDVLGGRTVLASNSDGSTQITGRLPTAMEPV